MSETGTSRTLGATLRGRWQIPLLSVSILVFGGGIFNVIASYHPLRFDEELQLARQMRAGGDSQRAIRFLRHLLDKTDRTPVEQGEIHQLIAETLYASEAPLRRHSKKNVHAIVQHLDTAIRLGLEPRASDWAILGDAYSWQGDAVEAEDAWRRSVRQGHPRPDVLRRRIISAELGRQPGYSAEVLGELDAMLDGIAEQPRGVEPTTPENYYWALERKMDWLLRSGDVQTAETLLAEARVVLEGAPQKLELTYLDALCQSEAGRPEQAEAELRTLRDHWTVQDELWGKSGRLLGELQLGDGRPQEALAFFEEVLRSFNTGPLNEECRLGRAQALFGLERYEAALSEYRALSEILPARDGVSGADRPSLRLLLAVGGRRLAQDAGTLAFGVEFLRLALSLSSPQTPAEWSPIAEELAAALSRLARRDGADDGHAERAGPDAPPRTALWTESADLYSKLASLETGDPDRAAEFSELAADHLEPAGEEDRAIELLTEFVADHPGHPRGPAMLLRVGRMEQARRNHASAAAIYQRVIEPDRRSLEALQALVPLAQCWIALGGDEALRGEELLLDIVDDRGPDLLLLPSGPQYREALMELGAYYARAEESRVPLHWEKAVRRLEDARALYPADPRVDELNFLLAESYRHSATELLALEQDRGVEALSAEDRQAARLRLLKAHDLYSELIERLGGRTDDAVNGLGATHLRLSYLYRGDCLFDLGRYAEAIEAYREAAWRYEGRPAAVSASMQIVHACLRLGQSDAARQATQRLKWLLGATPEAEFDVEAGMFPKAYWERAVERLERTRVF